MLGPIQTIIHLDRSIRLQLALRNVIGKLRTRTQAELIPMPIERMLKALTQRQFHPLHTGRQSAFQTVAVPELPAIRPPVAVMRLIPGSKLQERQQLIASPPLQPPPLCLSQIILCTQLQPTGNSKCRLQLIFETDIRPSGKILLLRPQGKRRNTQQRNQQNECFRARRYITYHKPFFVKAPKVRINSVTIL